METYQCCFLLMVYLRQHHTTIKINVLIVPEMEKQFTLLNMYFEMKIRVTRVSHHG